MQDLGGLAVRTASTTLGCACPVELTAIPGVEVEKDVAVHVLYAGTVAALRDAG